MEIGIVSMLQKPKYIIGFLLLFIVGFGAYVLFSRERASSLFENNSIDESQFIKSIKKSILSSFSGINAKLSDENILHIEDKIKEVLKEMDNRRGKVNKKSVPDTLSKSEVAPPAEFMKHIRSRELEHIELDLDDIQPSPKPKPSTLSHRWIVVTSIFGPTEDIKMLAAIPGWKLVVVGDKKTPKVWKHPGVVYLSVEDQLKSGFETVKYLKYGVYQRKNIGYLYAIQHGAKYIYDTDDDNHPYKGKITFDEMNEEKEYLMYNGKQHFYNGFAHFGQSTLWPRGYPLNMIDKAPVRKYKKCTNLRPLVQQGVVDGDPDLDAIQRLTRKDSNTKFVVYFDITAPPVVFPRNSFVPYNSQNTFHHYDAFFALLLPQTVTFRVNDIWRSFIAQRLMWDIGGHLAYFPPNAYQDRTPHDFLKDFYEEEDLYRNANPLSQLLMKWKGKGKDMFTRHFEVIKEVYKADILGALDVRLTRAWIRDLVRLGYVPPKIQNFSSKCKKGDVTFVPKEMPTLFNRIGQKTVNVVKIAATLGLTKERERDSSTSLTGKDEK